MSNGRAVASVQVNGAAMRWVRRGRGVPLSRLAEAADVSVSFLAQVERGQRRGVRLAVFRAIVSVLGLTDPRVLLCDPYGGGVTQLIIQMGSTVEPVAHDRLDSATQDRAA